MTPQKYGYLANEKCACRLITMGHVEAGRQVIDVDIDYCPLHAAAEDMATALKACTDALEWRAVGGTTRSLVADARAALAKAGR